VIWPDDHDDGTDVATREFASWLTLAVIVLLICLFLAACVEAITWLGTVYGL
jgi:hypothetical protein